MLRIRARHIFLAAPEGSAPDVAEAKDRQMLDIAARLGQGEDFGEPAATVSEDEASKKEWWRPRLFAADRVPVEFLTPLRSCSPMALRVSCARIWVFTRPIHRCPSGSPTGTYRSYPRDQSTTYRRETAQCRGRAEVRTGALDLFCGAMRNCALRGFNRNFQTGGI